MKHRKQRSRAAGWNHTPADDRLYDAVTLLRGLHGYGACKMLDEAAVLVYWAGAHPPELDALEADSNRGFGLRVETCLFSEAELHDAMSRLCDAVDEEAGLLDGCEMPVVGHETDASGLFAEVIGPGPNTANAATRLAGVPVRIVSVAHGPIAL